MAQRVIFRVGVMLVCLGLGSFVFTAYATTEVWTHMSFSEGQLRGLDTVIWNVVFPSSIVVTASLWKLWLFPPGYRPAPRIDTAVASAEQTAPDR